MKKFLSILLAVMLLAGIMPLVMAEEIENAEAPVEAVEAPAEPAEAPVEPAEVPAEAPAEIPEKDGHTFIGWDKAFDNVTDDLTVTAQFAINTETHAFENDESEITVEAYPNVVPAGSTLKTDEKAAAYVGDVVDSNELNADKATAYDIHFEKNDEEVQPTSEVMLKIPVPEGYDEAKCHVYYIDGDGNLTDMHAKAQDGVLEFEADDLGTFLVAELNYIPGDVNGDGEIDGRDATRLLQYLAHWNVLLGE